MNKKANVPMLVATLAAYAMNLKNNWDSAKAQLQRVLDLYNRTGLPALSSDELHLLFNNTEDLLYNKLTGNQAAHLTIGKGEDRGHLPIDRKAAMALITKPAGYNELLAGITECNKTCLGGFAANSPWHVRFAPGAIKELFVIDEAGTLDYSDKVKEEIAEAGNVYATTEKGQAIYGFIKKVCDLFIESGIENHIYNINRTGVVKVSGEHLAKLFSESIKEINIEDKSFVPMVTGSFTSKPHLYFDNPNAQI